MNYPRRYLLPVAALVFLGACEKQPVDTGGGETTSDVSDTAAESLLATNAHTLSGNPPAAANVQASYVLLASSGTAPAAYARVIIDDGLDCPSIAISCSQGPTTAMVARDKPRFSNVAHCPNGDCFPVTVCEAKVTFDQSHQVCLSGGAIDLPVANMSPAEILVMGDTGCKSAHHDPGGACEASGKKPAEPFKSLVDSTKSEFDLVLHMGDYNYRGTPGSVPWKSTGGDDVTHHPYDAGDGAPTCEQDASDSFRTQASSRSVLPDQWEIWQNEFFGPARSLLQSAPWVFARGNHELCSRAGPGWFYFLDAGFKPDGTQIDCPGLGGVDHPQDPYKYTKIAPMYQVGLKNLNIVVLDSANACDAKVPAKPNGFVTEYENQFANLSVPSGVTNWIVSHRPFWENATLQATSNDLASLTGISLSFAGHRHLFESYTSSTKSLPTEVVVGNSGVSLEGDEFETCSESTFPLQGGKSAKAWRAGAENYGFLHVSLTVTGWSALLMDQTGSTTASCNSDSTNSVCVATGQTCT